MLSEVWGMPKWKSRPAIQSKMSKRKPGKTIAHQLVEKKPRTRIPDSEIEPENNCRFTSYVFIYAHYNGHGDMTFFSGRGL